MRATPTRGTGIVAPFTDQRGFDRVGSADIGAFEFGAKGQQTITFAALADKTYGDADFTISAHATSRVAGNLHRHWQCQRL